MYNKKMGEDIFDMKEVELKKGAISLVIPVIVIAIIISAIMFNIIILRTSNVNENTANKGFFSDLTEEQRQSYIDIGKKVLIVAIVVIIINYLIDKYKRRNDIFNFQKSSNIINFIHVMLVIIPIVATVVIWLIMLYGGIVKSSNKIENQISNMPRPGSTISPTNSHRK